jgi:hypothetical protein
VPSPELLEFKFGDRVRIDQPTEAGFIVLAALCEATARLFYGVDVFVGNVTPLNISGELFCRLLRGGESVSRRTIGEASERSPSIGPRLFRICARDPGSGAALQRRPVSQVATRPQPLPVRLSARLQRFALSNFAEIRHKYFRAFSVQTIGDNFHRKNTEKTGGFRWI